MRCDSRELSRASNLRRGLLSESEFHTVEEAVWPSIDAVAPSEEGGPIARKGFNYQDEIAVGFVLEMLANPQLVKIHFETHDDLVLVWDIGAPSLIAEFVQVKGAEADKLWSVADLCLRKKQAVGSSIFEKSLDRDQHAEIARFRIVTLRPVVSLLTPLTYKRGHEARALTCAEMVALKSHLDQRMPGLPQQRLAAVLLNPRREIAGGLYLVDDEAARVARKYVLREQHQLAIGVDDLAVLRDDKDLARGRHLVHQGEAASLEFGGLDGLHGRTPWIVDDHDHDHGCTWDQAQTTIPDTDACRAA